MKAIGIEFSCNGRIRMEDTRNLRRPASRKNALCQQAVRGFVQIFFAQDHGMWSYIHHAL